MSRSGRWFAFVAIGVCALVGLRAQAQRPGGISVAEQYLFQAANAERQSRGIPPLRWDDRLYLAANDHAHQMAMRGAISHQFAGEAELQVRGRQRGARFSVIAENVAEAPSAVRIHDAWMQSPGHRENLLDRRVDSVGISVLSRDGQLYAVEDFDRSVASLSYDEQERTVGDLLMRVGSVTVSPASESARRTCQMETGYAGPQRPWFVMRYTAGDLSRLPDQLTERLATGKYRRAEVGACPARSSGSFSTFNIAVLLYP